MTADFIADKIVMDGLTYDDVLLVPAYSEVLPRTVDLSTKFSRNIELQIPFVTAAMDTVTEAPMAIAIAREGGIGVIHKNMSIEDQARQVAIVKRAENGMIYDPVTIERGRTVRDALQLMAEYHIGGIPVVDENLSFIEAVKLISDKKLGCAYILNQDKTLKGVITDGDIRRILLKYGNINDLRVKDVMVLNPKSVSVDDLAAKALSIMEKFSITSLGVVDNSKLIGIIHIHDLLKAGVA